MSELDRAASREGILVPTAALADVPLFAGLAAGELAEVTGSMRFHSYQPGEVLCREGEPASRMLVVVDGLANAMTFAPVDAEARGRSFFAEGRLVAKHRRGDPIGVRELITSRPHTATVKAVVATSALELGADEFRALLARFPRVLTNVVGILGERLAEADVRYARSGTRGEAVALLHGPALDTAAVAAACRAASSRPVLWIEAGASLSEALDTLDGALRDHGTVIVSAGLDAVALVEQVDRVVAVVTEAEADALAQRLASDDEVELALVGASRRRRGTIAGLRVAGGDDASWLGRHLTRTKLGLALGAGGAKGYAHVGALAVLEEAGYVVDCVAGSSIGAIVGTYLALGMRSAEIDATLRAAFTPETVAELFQLSLAGTSTGLDAMRRVLQETTHMRGFEAAQIPLAVMTADLAEREPAPLREGALWEALLAATALAGMFPPQERDGRRLVDGLALVPVPTGATVQDGADVTVAVNLMSRDTLPAWPGEPPPEPDAKRKRGSRMLETLLEVMDLTQMDASVRHAALADVVITPQFGPGTWREFELADRFEAAGRRAAEAQLPALRALARPQNTPHGGGNASPDVLVR